jgi:hypothetical protein
MSQIVQGVWSFLRGYDRELVCRRCLNVVAFVGLRPLSSSLRVRHVDGYEINPMGGWLLHQTQQQVAADEQAVATGAPDGADAADDLVAQRQRLSYLKASAGEVVFEFHCPNCGATYLRSLPDLTVDVRHAATGRVLLK